MTETLASIETVAALKRALTIGTIVTMVGHDWYPSGKLIGLARKVASVDSVKVGFAREHGSVSYMWWPRAAHYKATGADTFSVALDDSGKEWMHYRIGGVA